MEEQIKIKEAIKIVTQGGIVIFPTDTAFAISCRIDNHDAIEKLFAIRKRPLTQPTPVLVSSKEMAKEYIQDLDENVERKLMDRYWPGAVTIIVPAKESVDPLVQKNGGIGLRLPNHQTAQSIITGVGVGLLGTSANIHGEKTPYTVEDLDQNLIKQVDYVVEGTCTVGKESTVINSLTNPWIIVRQGAVEVNV